MGKTMKRVDISKLSFSEAVQCVSKKALPINISNVRDKVFCAIDMHNGGGENKDIRQKDITGFLFSENDFRFENDRKRSLFCEEVQKITWSTAGVLRLIFHNGVEKILGLKLYEEYDISFAEQQAMQELILGLCKKSFPEAEIVIRTGRV